MRNILVISQILVSVILIILILIQAKGTGFGRSGFSGSTSFTRRGLEKFIFRLTFIFAFIFILISIFINA